VYTRNPRNTQRIRTQQYTPPPGYAGNTFSGKYHSPDYVVEGNVPRRPGEDEDEAGIVSDQTESGIRQESTPPDTNPLTCTGEEKNDSILEDTADNAETAGKSAFGELLESLKGKIGSEELIILMVMLLIASDGMCAEVLILALCLAAGG
jgi:hypothetical protein